MLPNTNTIFETICLVASEFAGQVDKAGTPKSEHMFRVAAKVMDRGYDDDNEVIKAALLHDIVEDTDIVVNDLIMVYGYSADVALMVDALTHRKGSETYAEYIERVKARGGAVVDIKLADIEDHLDTADAIPKSLVNRYLKAREVLTS